MREVFSAGGIAIGRCVDPACKLVHINLTDREGEVHARVVFTVAELATVISNMIDVMDEIAAEVAPAVASRRAH